MWPKSYRDYPKDQPLKKEQVSPGNGITGCEMHEYNGWGNSYHSFRPKRRGAFYHFLKRIFGGRS
jgi:hypothetical protein